MTNENNAATLKAAQGGVTEAMVEEVELLRVQVYDLREANADLRERSAALEAALSAQQGQGEAVAWIDEYGNVFPLGAHSVNGKLSWKDAHKRSWRPLYTATPAQPAERVPEGWTAWHDDVARTWTVRSPAGDVCEVHDRAGDVHAEVLRQLAQDLAASPAPSTARGDGGEG